MRTFKDHLLTRLNRLREVRQELTFKELKPLRLEDFQHSEQSTQASENGGFGLHNPRDRQMTHTHNDVMAYPNLDPNDLGRTGTFWFAAQSGVMQSGIGSDLNEN